MYVASAKQIADIDRRTTEEYGIAAGTLMERAGQAVADVAISMLSGNDSPRVVVVCGKGNNGGDGLVAARHLRRANVQVETILLSPESELSGNARRAFAEAQQDGVVIRAAGASDGGPIFAGADLIIDAIFGTGFKGPARGRAAELISSINHAGKPVLSVDIPSGVSSDTGSADGAAIRASATITMGFLKVGLLVSPGADLAGEILVADIGYPEALSSNSSVSTHFVTSAMVRSCLPVRRPDSHKGDHGHVLIVAGSMGFTGAAVLATRGALRSGAGLVTLAVPKSVYPIIAAQVVEGMPTPLPDSNGALAAGALKQLRVLRGGSDVAAVGPGLSQAAGVRRVVQDLLAADGPVVLDADGLNVLVGKTKILSRASSPLVITPHPGELGRLMNIPAEKVQEDRLSAARTAAKRFKCTVLLKGARTVVATAAGDAYIVPTGNPGMATGGMGDVLTGAIASLIGQGLDPTAAAYCGAYLHGLAADLIASERGMAGILASEVADHLPVAIEHVRLGKVRDPITQLPQNS
ncbi:MAG TPA: NAD(P)H-hydrate dehydratase [bacterium]|nr:NAD(P)H-hydrate dehydratase [bacterium]